MGDIYVRTEEDGSRQIYQMPGEYGKSIWELPFKKEDTWLAVGLLACGFLFWEFVGGMLFTPGRISLGAGVPIFTIAILGICLVYFKAAGIKQNRRSLCCLFLIFLMALPFLLFGNEFLSFINLLLLMGIFLYWVCLSTDRTIQNHLSALIIGDAINQVILVPFGNFICVIAALKAGTGKSRRGKNFLLIMLGLLIVTPMAAGVVNLLMSADVAFSYIVQKMIDSISLGSISKYAFHFILGIPVAFYLFGVIYGNSRGGLGTGIKEQDMHKAEKVLRIAPPMMVCPALVIFNLIYLVFLGAQAGYFFSAFYNILPESMTYAEYARNGFFQLCTVAIINLCIIAGSNLLSKSGEKGKRSQGLSVLTALLALLTILIIVTAMSKMIMYIKFYGLSPLRVYPSIFMIGLLLVFVVVLIRQFAVFNGARVIIVGVIALMLVTFYVNIDGSIAKYNIGRYEEGSLPSLDYGMLKRLNSGGILAMQEAAENTKNPKFAEELRENMSELAYMDIYYQSPYNGDYRTFNLQDFKAEAAMKDARAE